MNKKIFVFGNEFFEGDEVPKKIAKLIIEDFKFNTKFQFDFIFAESPNEILNAKNELIILDVVKGINEVKLLENIDDLILANSVTCHDLDLGFYLKLMKQTGQITKVKIIGIPFGNTNYLNLKEKIEKILLNVSA